MLKMIRRWFAQRLAVPLGESAAANLADVAIVHVGDQLVAKDDVLFGRAKSTNVVAWHAYEGRSRFTAGKAYKVVQVRRRTKIAFLIDDQGFRTAVDRIIARHFTLTPSVSHR